MARGLKARPDFSVRCSSLPIPDTWTEQDASLTPNREKATSHPRPSWLSLTDDGSAKAITTLGRESPPGMGNFVKIGEEPVLHGTGLDGALLVRGRRSDGQSLADAYPDTGTAVHARRHQTREVGDRAG